MILAGKAKKLRRERNDLIWHAWHVEAFARQKKLPRLKDLLAGQTDKSLRKAMSPHEIEAAMRGVFAAKRRLTPFPSS
jgi:hypothetical protein